MTCIEGQYYIVKLGCFDINLNVQHVNGITPFFCLSLVRIECSYVRLLDTNTVE